LRGDAVNSSPEPKTSGWGELGPKWITAIAALLTALTGAGFFIGRSTAQDTKSGSEPTSAVTVTVTVPYTAAAENAPVTAGSSSVPPGPAPTVFWTGHLEFGQFNLDVKPPIQTGDTYIVGSGGVMESYGGAARLTVWTSNGTPDRNACATAVGRGSSTYINGLVEGNHVCGRTAEGRIFRIDINTVGGDISGNVTIWER
jgi:hypothetical protein